MRPARWLGPLLLLLVLVGPADALTLSALTQGGTTTDATSFTTASIAPAGNRLVLAAVAYRGGNFGDPTLTGNGLTWTAVASFAFDTIASPTERVVVYRAMGASPTAGTVLIDFGANTATVCLWAIVQTNGDVDTSGSGGSGAVVQSQSNGSDTAGTSVTVTLAAFADPARHAVFIASFHAANESSAEEAGYTELSDGNQGTPPAGLATAWKLGEDTSPSYSWVTSNRYGAVALEIKSGGTPQRTLTGVGQ